MLSMTGFGTKQAHVSPIGKVTVELRSSNLKYFEGVFHLPEGFVFLEERLRKEIESKIRRGRITCTVSVGSERVPEIALNKTLLKNYIATIKGVARECKVADDMSISMLLSLPGVLSLGANASPSLRIWPQLQKLIRAALHELIAARQKEGRALQGFFRKRSAALRTTATAIRTRFQKSSSLKAATYTSLDERSAFLKTSDITEELERLIYHIRNFTMKLGKTGSIGKELDFIAQEMQREANTIGAKSFDAVISGMVVQAKAQIEKIREQVQNIE